MDDIRQRIHLVDNSTSPVCDEPAVIWMADVSTSPAARAGVQALLGADPSIRLWDTGQPSEPNIITTVMATDAATLEDAVTRWPYAGLVMIGGDYELAYTLDADRPVALLSVETEAEPLIAAIHAVFAGLTVVEPAMIDEERGILAGLSRTGSTAAHEVLTPRERQVLGLVAAGLPNKTIARELGISEHTAKFHVGSLLAKLGAASRTEAVTLAARRGILII